MSRAFCAHYENVSWIGELMVEALEALLLGPVRGESKEPLGGMVDVLLRGVALDRAGDAPLHRQVYLHIRSLILGGLLPPDMALPATRTLAEDLGVSRNTVVAAYAQLESDGLVSSRHGSHSRVLNPFDRDTLRGAVPADGAPRDQPVLSKRGDLMIRQPFQMGIPGRTAFLPGAPDIRQFPFKTWRNILTRQLRATAQQFFGYQSILGHPPLQEAIARNLATTRGMRCQPGQVVITTGAQAALDLLARILISPGDPVWMEEPGYTGAQSAFLSAGAQLVALPVSEDGWHPTQVKGAPPRLIYLTPSCHAPLGVTMAREQRLQFIDIARAANAWIIEDDFDGEYRFTGPALPAIHGLESGDRTIYLGSFAKTMFPALRLGFAVLPGEVAQRIEGAVFHAGAYAPLVLQGALAEFIEEGHFARHMRRMRRLYADRRSRFVALCSEILGAWLLPMEGYAGMQTGWWLRAPLRDQQITALARERAIVVVPLSSHYRHAGAQQGLILGFASLSDSEARAALNVLRDILAGSERGPVSNPVA